MNATFYFGIGTFNKISNSTASMKAPTEPMAYKRYHEDYMKNHTGSTAGDIMIVALPAPLAVFISTSLLTMYAVGAKRKSNILALLVEFLVIVLPTILCFTVLSDLVHVVVILWMVISILLLVTNPDAIVHRLWNKSYLHQFLDLTMSDGRRVFITNFRATVNLITAICILAVDFEIFPRRYAKTENYGYGLMDAGVGLFCIANAIISPEALGHKKFKTFLASVGNSIKTSTPLLLLGGARLFTTQQVDYQMHTSEYGVHWNFFITLAVVKIVSSLIMSFVDARYSLLLAFSLLAVHEYVLESGIQNWVLGHTPRIGILDANREGIVSSLGYVALYFAGIALGQLLQQSSATTVKKNVILEMKLIMLAGILWICTFLCEYSCGISRRLANLGYCMWTLAYCVTLLGVFLLVELMICAHSLSLKVKSHSKTAKHKNTIIQTILILEAISYNGLFFFLIANLCTGLININIQTLHVEKIPSLLIINTYMLIICTITVVLYTKQIKLKVW